MVHRLERINGMVQVEPVDIAGDSFRAHRPPQKKTPARRQPGTADQSRQDDSISYYDMILVVVKGKPER
mgnify:FL=1